MLNFRIDKKQPYPIKIDIELKNHDREEMKGGDFEHSNSILYFTCN